MKNENKTIKKNKQMKRKKNSKITRLKKYIYKGKKIGKLQ